MGEVLPHLTLQDSCDHQSNKNNTILNKAISFEGRAYMDDNTYIICLAAITVLSIVCTVIISLKYNTKKLYKYLPSIIILIGSVIYCAIVTVIDYSKYIGILYLGIFVIVAPAILLSLIIALIFDITRFLAKRKRD